MPSPTTTARDEPLVAILLAAGSSRRFGADKLTATLPNGDYVVAAAARSLLAATPTVLGVVRTENSGAAEALKRMGIPVLVTREAERGMGATLAAAVRHTASARGWLVALGDMPYLAPRTVQAVAAALTSTQGIVVPIHRGRRGHPVAFGCAYRQRLSNLDGHRGARTVLNQFSDNIIPLDCPDPGVLTDIDRPADIL